MRQEKLDLSGSPELPSLSVYSRLEAHAANDNVPDDDGPFLLALGLICAVVVALAVYVGMSGPDDLMTAALRR